MCGIDELIIKCRDDYEWKDCSKCMNKSNIAECMSELRGIQKHYFNETVFNVCNNDISKLNKDDKEFLKQLQHEMLTQPTVCQADPRFWVIRQEEKEYWVDENIEGLFIYDGDSCDTLFEGYIDSNEMKEWLVDFVNNHSNGEITNIEGCCDLSFEFNEKEYYLTTNKELEDFINDKCGTELSVGYYRTNPVIKENTMFLTNREAKEHLKSNAHHYNSTAHTYAMTAWRSPQVERLYKIIQNTNWEEL